MLLALLRPRFSVSGVFMMGALGLMVACGPSLRMIHESDTYYERCYAADVDPDISVETRHECWARWLEHYTPGQPPERVAHARTRVSELQSGVSAAPLPGSPEPVAEALDGGVAAAGDQGPPSTDASPEHPVPDSPEARAVYRSPPPVSTTTACDPICRAQWEECIPRCDDRTRACRAACQSRYRNCQAACY